MEKRIASELVCNLGCNASVHSESVEEGRNLMRDDSTAGGHGDRSRSAIARVLDRATSSDLQERR